MSIKLKNINIDYGNFLAVDNLNMEIKKGELVSLLGPSGCGKTTALNAIAGLINTTSGQMLFDGVDVTQKPSQKRNIGLVFQSYALYTHMNVFKNIAYPLYHSKTFKKELKQENYLNKLRLKTLIEAEGYELIINQQTKFDNFIINFKEDLDKLIGEELVNFLKANKAALNEYLDLAFAENDESDLRVINAKNQLKSYLYDKSKIKFNQKVNELNICLNKNIKEILKNPHDIRFANLLKFFEYNIQNSINEFQSHSSEIAKTMKKTKRNISKLEDRSIGLAIFTGSRTASYDVFEGKRKEIEKDFFNNEFKHAYNLVDQFLLEVNQYLSTNVFVNSAYSKLILKVNTSLKKSIKDITTKISGDSKISDKTKLVNFILINSKETIIAKIRAHNDELKNVMTQYIEFIDKTNYFVNDFESVILPLFNVETVSIEENTRNLKYKDEFIKEVSNSLQEIFKASFVTVDKELSSKSLKIDTTEKQNEIKKQIFSRNRKIKELVYQTAKQVEIENQLNKKPSELSGGQQQRVAIARAIVKKPGILLMDEPLSNLDAKLRLTTREWIKRFQQSVGITTIFVTHDQEEAMSISDSIFVMNKGVLQQSGTPLEIYNKPANEFVANFIGTPNINFLSVKKSKNTFALPSGEILKYNNLPEDQTEFKLGIRPEKITLKKTAGSILLATGSVILVEQLGKQNHIKIKVSKDLELTLVSDPAEWASIKNKDEINLYINKKEIYVFGKDKNLVEATYAK